MVDLGIIAFTPTGLRIAGDLDIATGPELEQAVSAVLQGWTGATMEIDMAECTFIDSAGLSALIRAGRHAEDRGIRATIAEPNPVLLRLLKITGIDGVAPFDVESGGTTG
jgi:anti-sigma B factor antagonist